MPRTKKPPTEKTAKPSIRSSGLTDSTTQRTQRGLAVVDWGERFLALVSQKLNVTKAAAVCGVSRETVYKRCERDPAFRAAFEEARHTAKDTLVERIFDASENDWKAAAWMLARVWPDEFGERKEVKHSGNVGIQPAQVVDAFVAMGFDRQATLATIREVLPELGDGETLEAEYRVDEGEREAE